MYNKFFVSLIRFRCIERRNQHSANLTALILQGLVNIFGNITCFKKQFHPIFCFIALFLCNFQFGYKILRPLRIMSLVNICADRRSRTQKLIGQNWLFHIRLVASNARSAYHVRRTYHARSAYNSPQANITEKSRLLSQSAFFWLRH